MTIGGKTGQCGHRRGKKGEEAGGVIRELATVHPAGDQVHHREFEIPKTMLRNH